MRRKLIRSLLAAGVLAGAGSAVAVGATAGAAPPPPSIVGSSWSYTFTWPGYAPGTSTWTLEAGHVATTSTWPGPLTYIKSGSSIKVVFKNDKTLGYHCHAIYVGTITGTHMSGTMSTNGRRNCIATAGTWTATRDKVDAPAKLGNHASPGANGGR
jgi:hypothetical protein